MTTEGGDGKIKFEGMGDRMGSAISDGTDDGTGAESDEGKGDG